MSSLQKHFMDQILTLENGTELASKKECEKLHEVFEFTDQIISGEIVKILNSTWIILRSSKKIVCLHNSQAEGIKGVINQLPLFNQATKTPSSNVGQLIGNILPEEQEVIAKIIARLSKEYLSDKDISANSASGDNRESRCRQAENFFIQAENAEFTFTFYYPLDGPLRDKPINKDDSPLKAQGTGVERRLWEDSELAHYVSSNFMGELILGHFHIDPSEIDHKKTNFARNFSYAKNFLDSDQNNLHTSIAPIECTLFRNGYLSVIVRLRNDVDISFAHVLEYIKHPELVRHNFNATQHDDPVAGSLRSGVLINSIWKEMQFIETVIAEEISKWKIEGVNFQTGEWKSLRSDEINNSFSEMNRPTPYVGLLFQLPNYSISNNFAEDSSQDDSPENKIISRTTLKRFIIAAGRTTPSFLDDFNDPNGYLSEENRNVYGQGNSIIFIGLRGWCSFDFKEQNPHAFRLGVIETTHFVITAIRTSALARRRFCELVHHQGTAIFQELNNCINRMVRSGLWVRFAGFFWTPLDFKENVAKATSFLARARLVSPCEDMASLLEAHLTSQTSQVALKRCSQLTGLSTLAGTARDLIASYSSFLKTSADYLTVKTLQVGQLAFVVALIALGLSLIK